MLAQYEWVNVINTFNINGHHFAVCFTGREDGGHRTAVIASVDRAQRAN